MPPDDIAPGTLITGFEAILPADRETCARHIAESIGRDLREAIGRKRLTIVANGPSAQAYFDREAGWHHGQPSFAPVAAVNGVLSRFLENGLRPHYWIACDPQALVADFLPDDPPEDITYLVASRCHPAVFDKLRGRDVVRWHLKDGDVEGRAAIPQACSVTISGAWLFHRMGYTDFEFWGWDGCWLDGQHHAGDGEIGPEELALNIGGEMRDGEVVGGRVFRTTRSWAAEMQSAQQFFQLAEYFDLRVTIHGAGMMRAARDAILGAPTCDR